MNTRRVNTVADVINAALTQNRTAAGIALALESAQLLQSPETAAELEHLRAQRGAVPYILGDSKVPKDLREQLVALLTEILRQGVPGPALTGGMEAQGEMEAALSSAFARKMYPAPGLFPSAATQVHQMRAQVAELEDTVRRLNTQRGDVAQLIEREAGHGEECVDIDDLVAALSLGSDEFAEAGEAK